MAGKTHAYAVTVRWTGNRGSGTLSFRDYDRDHEISADGKPNIGGSSDPSFRGDPTRWNPEELLLASLSACHKLWYLGLCAQSGVTVLAYEDMAEGEMVEEADGAGQFVRATLRPRVTISAASDPAKAAALHETAHAMCFIARSVNFVVACEPVMRCEA
ncbi:peroxiredoxin [Aureimonas sp. Leaf454]|uniref:OsmC family protein n=1 Tax=Aureimonas sp. Leaf454 TaxID=1736381 RepID=UPI0006F890C4|nr:OsmC family protein [Aureimonas sp. Leaf454]KQT54759.1 peroxiredoxin [Aureimonas sp. Leaf454]